MWASLLAVLMTFSLGVASAAARTPKHGADLVVTDASVDTGTSKPYLVVYPNGRAKDQHVDVTFTVENVGDRAAAANLGRVTLESQGHVLADDVFDIHRLGPGKKERFPLIALFHPEARVGPLHVYVKPNWNFHVVERRYANNHHLVDEIPVVANRWNVRQWTAHSISDFGLVRLDDNEIAQPDFFLQFDQLEDNRFVYRAYGAFVDHTNYDSPSCVGSGSGTASHSPWSSDSAFEISYGLTRYGANIDMSGEDTFKFTITCNPGGARTTSAKFFDTLTNNGRTGAPAMSPTDRKVSGSGTLGKGLSGTVSHHWIFAADAPKRT